MVTKKTTRRLPRVFVIQQPKPNRNNWVPNLEPATQFGAIHYLFNGQERPADDPDAALDDVIAMLEREEYQPDVDYILWPNTGDPIGVYATLLAIGQNYPCCQVLNWDRKLVNGESSKTEGFYTAVRFNLQ